MSILNTVGNKQLWNRGGIDDQVRVNSLPGVEGVGLTQEDVNEANLGAWLPSNSTGFYLYSTGVPARTVDSTSLPADNASRAGSSTDQSARCTCSASQSTGLAPVITGQLQSPVSRALWMPDYNVSAEAMNVRKQGIARDDFSVPHGLTNGEENDGCENAVSKMRRLKEQMDQMKVSMEEVIMLHQYEVAKGGGGKEIQKFEE
ncbi:hypothetical protein AQUCO_04000041v1 [Aquilegia coerulea]|uniref:Uncharacterized protein n=1 Tax=Aquilegia coerulea TaxID=218851 RepID=A0A2G5CR12_AQUCA|nr:hypothetical protein AQUCO_04000041v1 [Aquilegia coerulea]